MVYRERRLASVPLEKLQLPAREPTPSISLSGNSSTFGSKSKTRQEMPGHSKGSENNQDRSEESAKDTAQSMEFTRQQVIASLPRDVPPLVIEAPPIITELDKEWETFNELINLEGQAPKTPMSNTQVAQEVGSALLFNERDDQIREAEQAEWKQKAPEKGKAVQALNRLNWECYWAYLVKSHSQQMTVKCIINAAEKVVPALIDSVFSAQLKEEVSQPTLLKPMMNACSFKDQIQK